MQQTAPKQAQPDGAAREIPILPSVYGLYMLRFLQKKGIRHEAVLEGSNLERRFFEQPDQYLSMRQLEPLLTRIRELAPAPSTAFEFGQELGPVSHGLVGFTLFRRMSFREMVRCSVEYLRVRLPLMDLHIQDSEAGLTLTIEDLWQLDGLREFVTQIYMGSLCTLTHMITRNTSLQFSFPPPENPAIYERLAGCRVAFSGEANQAFVSFSSTEPDPVKINTDVLTSGSTNGTIDLEDDREVVVQVRHILLKHPGRDGTLEKMAHRLDLSPRSLRRKLANAGFSFSELRNEVRQEFATRYLTGTSMSLEKIATRLGYSDQASFSKAFRSWTGRNPGTVRREARDR